ncbi:putative transcription factor C3H family [Rosa chinensis]|uniref:Putative transcription factor C3H family n=1 Tax=Rosa chinensis TaxID=74649 RepID=A0A2P6RJ29_ROSCH|nr:zinc finger CCCH domain-containing protein 34 [Rosa chinensis]PRQ46440.1 putative transcription factor C3H family [Rosa chinensis]
MEEQDLLNRNTDCVHFMASPPACDKGLECEFRHSKMARLNPKVCWYWLAGECFNPTCAFRHPPLEGHEAAPSETTPSSISANKSNIPCYFYLNGMCNKGDRCSFLHDADGSASTGKCSNTASACTEALPSENKASTVNETVSAPTVAHQNPLETAAKATVDAIFQPKQDLDYREQLQKSASPHVSEYGDEEADEIRSNSLLLPAEASIHSKSPLFTDQSSEEGADDLIVQEEWWESSPGFDVLVDGKSEEDSPEYFPTLDGEHWELNKEWHDYDNPDEYDPQHPGAELLHENQIYDSYDCLDTRYLFGNERSIHGYAEDRMLDSILSRKRKLMPLEVAVDDQDGLDLRNHLRRRRVIDDYSSSGLSRMHESIQLIGRSQEWPQRHDTGWQRRLASEVENRTFESRRENESFNNAGIERRPHRHTQHYRSRKHQERRLAKPEVPSSGFSRRPIPRDKRSSIEDSTVFTGPKSLAQIKEEKMKAEENGRGIRKSRCVQRTRDDFQGPKPFTEILKEKRKLADRSGSGSN